MSTLYVQSISTIDQATQVQVGDLSTKTATQNSNHVTLSSVAGTNTITALVTPVITSYTTNQTFRFIAAGTNTGAVTISICGLSVVDITKQGSTALVAGDIVAGQVMQITYDGTRFQLIGVAAASSASSGATGAGKDLVFVENDAYITSSYVVGKNSQSTCTISIATPAVVTQTNTYVGGEAVFFMTTGALPTGLTANNGYYVSATGLSSTSFQVSATRGGASIATSGTQGGSQTCGKLKHASLVGPFLQASGSTTTVPSGARLVIL